MLAIKQPDEARVYRAGIFERRGKERNEKQVVWFPYESQQQVLKRGSFLEGPVDTKTKNKYAMSFSDIARFLE